MLGSGNALPLAPEVSGRDGVWAGMKPISGGRRLMAQVMDQAADTAPSACPTEAFSSPAMPS